jgi:hypothetical protein
LDLGLDRNTDLDLDDEREDPEPEPEPFPAIAAAFASGIEAGLDAAAPIAFGPDPETVVSAMAGTAEDDPERPEALSAPRGPAADAEPPITPRSFCSHLDRESFKTDMGTHYNIHVRPVAAALARMPALRGTDAAAARTELTAVRAYLHERSAGFDAAALDAALRAGTISPYGLCLTAGLRRLPVHLGAVFVPSSGDPAGPGDRSTGDLPGRVRVEAAPLRGSASIGDLSPGGLLIWSASGRRTALLDWESAGANDQVMFLPGSRFRVLTVAEAPDSGAPLVLLRELGDGRNGPERTGPEADADFLERLSRLLIPRVQADGADADDADRQDGLR